MILAGTGHRPPKLGGYELEEDLALFAGRCLRVFAPRWVISGGALGWDQALAWAALEQGIPLALAIPFWGQERSWPEPAQKRYRMLRARAAWEHVVSPGGYSAAKMHARNRWMVDNSTHVLALWDGSDGGTAGCVRYALEVGAPVYNVWPLWERRSVRPGRLAGPPEAVTNFHGTVFSNFAAVDGGVALEGLAYPTVEHAFQAAKTLVGEERARVRGCATAASAKAAGRRVTLRQDWEEVKVQVMLGLLRQKFRLGSGAANRLLATGTAALVEGNTWGDRFWGQCPLGTGENHLGRLLMQIREELVQQEGFAAPTTDAFWDDVPF